MRRKNEQVISSVSSSNRKCIICHNLNRKDVISVVGSSTVYPFSTTVAEIFGKTSNFKTPKIESTGSGGGMKLFRSGVGLKHPDISNASHRIKKSECDKGRKNGVTEIIEIKIGYDGIVRANSKTASLMQLNRKDIFLALAAKVPGKDSKLIDNPCQTWACVNPDLPDTKIEVLGPLQPREHVMLLQNLQWKAVQKHLLT